MCKGRGREGEETAEVRKERLTILVGGRMVVFVGHKIKARCSRVYDSGWAHHFQGAAQFSGLFHVVELHKFVKSLAVLTGLSRSDHMFYALLFSGELRCYSIPSLSKVYDS